MTNFGGRVVVFGFRAVYRSCPKDELPYTEVISSLKTELWIASPLERAPSLMALGDKPTLQGSVQMFYMCFGSKNPFGLTLFEISHETVAHWLGKGLQRQAAP